MYTILNKLRKLKENTEIDECNCTPEGTNCPKHGMDECEMFNEEDNEDPTNNAVGNDDSNIDTPEIPEPDSNTKDKEPADSKNDDIKIDDRGVEDGLDSSEDSEEEIKKQDDMYYNAIKNGDKVPEEVVEPDRFIRYYEQKYGVNEEKNEESASIYEVRGGENASYEKNKKHWLVQSLEDGEAKDHEMFPPNQKEKALELAKKLRDSGLKGVKVVHPSKESFNENISIQVDQEDAYELIRRMAELSGNNQMQSVKLITQQGIDNTECDQIDNTIEHCPHCGMQMGGCLCSGDNDNYCPSCGAEDGYCDCDVIHNDSLAMENIDNDFGHIKYNDLGEPIDRNTYLYRAPNGNQRVTKARGGDNALINYENIDEAKIYSRLKKDYKQYIKEAELNNSNAPGANSPLTANSRDEFEKDPFVKDEPVTDGSRSPMSTIKRQNIAK
jgi:hypothetical protein